jgi:two-component system OmpR family sensor kinase/two-component system sensor histidine kinase BaeS
MKSSVNPIRRRLLSLLGRAFVGVLLLSLFLFFVITAYVVTYYPQTNNIRFPIIAHLEGYYLGHGNWDGVEAVFQLHNEFPPERTLLLDQDNRVVLDGGLASVSTVGSIYESGPRDIQLPLQVKGQRIGTLVVTHLPFQTRGRLAGGILIPIGLISSILALFLVVVAFLLTRRFVNPLADVIYAARSVADGKLDTRITVSGPQDLRGLSDSFNEMAAALERSDHERRAMLADVAHELRTPLSVIRGRLEGIVDGIYPTQVNQISPALESVYLLERITDDLRLLTLAETRQLHFEKANFDLGELANRVVDIFGVEAREKNISLTMERGDDDLSIFADPQRTEQAISNLVGNALRYVPDGGKVWLVVERADDGIVLRVNDNGSGIPEADLPYVFDRFWRKDKSRSRTSGGTGLGLAIAKQLIEAQGGKISASNLPGGGLQISVQMNARGNQ